MRVKGKEKGRKGNNWKEDGKGGSGENRIKREEKKEREGAVREEKRVINRKIDRTPERLERGNLMGKKNKRRG